MGTSLFNTTPQATYPSLIKLGDNLPLTATLKALSDGLGNDSVLALSTISLQIGGATGATWDNTNKRLGIGTSAPLDKLTVSGGNMRIDNGNKLFMHESGATGNGYWIGTTAAAPYTTQISSNVNTGRGVQLGLENSSSIFVPFFSLINQSATSAFVGINTVTPTAQTHIKGSGSTSATTSLLVQNSASTQLLSMADDGKAIIGTNTGNSGALLFQYPTTIATNGVFWGDSYSTIYGAITLSRGTGEMRFATYAGGYYPTFYSNAVEAMRIDISQNVGIGTTTQTARLQVKGSGATSATTALLVQNSAGTQLLNIRDDGFTTIGQSNQGISTHNLTATNYIVCGSTSAHYFQLGAGLVLRSPSDGVATFLNGAESGFNRINLGGTTSSFPAIKRNAAQIDFKLADDSTFAAISSGGLIVNGNSITLVGAIGNTSAMRIDAGATTGLLRLSTTSVNIGGNTTNDASALLQVDTTTQGFLPPRMTTTQKNAIATPATGLVVYDSTLAKLCVYTTAWETITSL